eukprot:Blabericola_migrator_1__5627@NODE_285_length_10382_cov_182_229956_g235_i0_p1_GENE_NODE_285_length_10382_cov_182_229956_g235_i0NODE_285_length_10382_cov_182_229956_g235_i0_p1_ORF_typecomplete_len556_score114_68SET/PF00856_28/1_3e18DNA_pol_phi/PF04931_13/0_02_NODE_285_length_10382_cov_182_229956_g235_i082779944
MEPTSPNLLESIRCRTVDGLSELLNDDERMASAWDEVTGLQNISETIEILSQKRLIPDDFLESSLLAASTQLVSQDKGHAFGVYASRPIRKGEVVALCRPVACVCDVEVDECFKGHVSEEDEDEEDVGTSEGEEEEEDYETETDSEDFPEHATETLLTAIMMHNIGGGDTSDVEKRMSLEAMVSMHPRTWEVADALSFERIEDERLVRILKAEMRPAFYQELAAFNTPAGTAFSEVFSKLSIEDQIHWLIMKTSCNIMACRVDSDALDDRRRDEFYSLYHLGHFFNHSCVANCVPTYIGDIMIVRAVKDVETGDELCFSYVHIDDLRDPADVRNIPLFDCKCARCEKEEEPLKPTDIDDNFTLRLFNSIATEVDAGLVDRVTAQLQSMVKLDVDMPEPFQTLAHVVKLPTRMSEKIDCLEQLGFLWSSLSQSHYTLWAVIAALYALENKAQRAELERRFPEGAAFYRFVATEAVKFAEAELALDDTIIPYQIHLAGILARLDKETHKENIEWALKMAYDQHTLCFGGGMKLFQTRQGDQIEEYYGDSLHEMLKNL